MSVINDFQVSGLFPSVVSAAVSTAQYFPRLLGSSIGVQSVAPSSTSAAGQLVVPGNSELEGQYFDVFVAGNILSGADASETAFVELVANTGTITSPSYTSIATTGLVDIDTVAPGNHVFGIRCSMVGTTASGIVGGSYSALVDGVLKNGTPKQTTALSGISMSSALPFGLAVRITFSAADAVNVAKLTQFQIAGA